MSTTMTAYAKSVGKPILDATADLTINVKPRDVAKAIPEDPCRCVLSCGGIRENPDSIRMFTYGTTHYEELGDKILRRMTTPGARKQLKTFDRTGVFEPGAYVFTAPKGSETLGAINVRSAPRKNHHPDKPGTILRSLRGFFEKGAKRAKPGKKSCKTGMKYNVRRNAHVSRMIAESKLKARIAVLEAKLKGK